ncbi:MAG: glycosyltransferase family 4 protein [Candidatus Thorarchaeota archaeon]
MRITIFVESFVPHRGYMEYHLADELLKLGHHVNIITFGNSNESVEFEKGTIEVTRIPYYLKKFSYHLPTLKSFIELTRIIKKERPHVILCNPLFSPLSLFSSFYQKISRGKVIGSLITGGPIATTSGLFRYGSVKSLLRYIIVKMIVKLYIQRTANRILSLSSGIERMIRKSFDIPAEKLRIMPLGADSNMFSFDKQARERIRMKLGIAPEETVIVWSGRIVPSKNLPHLLESFANIANDVLPSKILIIGDGKKRQLDLIKTLCRTLKIEHSILLHPMVPRNELPGYYSASDIAVWPGSPSISIVEAASVGLPLIIKKSPFSSYIVSNNNGFVFNPSDPQDLGSKISLLLSDDENRTAMGRRSRQLIQEQLNWFTITQRFVDYCKEILN